MRKKVLFLSLIAAITLSSCTAKYPVVVLTHSIDYSKHMSNGFFLTESNSVSFDYSPVGSVQVTLQDGWEVVQGKKAEGYYTNEEFSKIKLGNYAPTTYREALDILVSKAEGMGADGIIGLKFSFIPPIVDKLGNKTGPSKITASGMAIKR